MIKFTKAIMGKFRIHFILFILLFLIYLKVISNSFDFEYLFAMLIGFCAICMTVYNSSLTLFPAINKDSSDDEIIRRGLLIVVMSISMIVFLII